MHVRVLSLVKFNICTIMQSSINILVRGGNMQLVMYLLDTRICYSSIEASCWPPIDCMIKLRLVNFKDANFPGK